MILIITNKEDVHPSPVIDILNRRRVPFFRFNTEALLTEYEFCWWANEHETDFILKNLINGQSIKGSEITVVWDRRPERPKDLFLSNTDEINKHNLQEALGFLYFLRYYIKDIPSIGSIASDRIASSKMLQYKVAQSVGFSVPKTLFTNRKYYVESFFQGYPKLAVKPIDSSDVLDAKTEMDYIFYTQTLNGEQLQRVPDEAFSQTVSFLQSYIEKQFELRATVVGQDVFAAKIDSQKYAKGQGAEDWRQAEDPDKFLSSYELNDEDQKKCIEVVTRLGLNFGCLDFVVQPDGDLVFLECNPNGQWLWIELATKASISESIANYLVNHN